jgi:hypothetical protein
MYNHQRVQRQGDEMFCPDCGKRWDVDDPEPPPCDHNAAGARRVRSVQSAPCVRAA